MAAKKPPAKEAPPPPPPAETTVFGLAKAWGPVVALAVGGTCGYLASRGCDLLDAVLRGAAAWLGVVVVWVAGVSVCEWLVSSTARPAPAEEARTDR